MKKDLKAILDLYRDRNIAWCNMFMVGFGMTIGLPLAMIWRAICAILFMIFGILKIFKPRARYIDVHKYEKCPQCGKELCYYHHGADYIFCECGYDSRKE